MDIRVLRYFVAAAQSKSISAASKALYITQPTLTRQFKELEDELGHTLFVRSKNGIELTDEGELFYERALEILALIERMTDEIKNQEELRGTIAIAAAETSSMDVVARAMKRFSDKYPGVSFSVSSVLRIDALRLVDTFCYDFALLIRPADPKDYDMLNLNEICSWGIFVKKDDEAAKLESITADKLHDMKVIFPLTESNDRFFEGWLDKTMQESSKIIHSFINNTVYMIRAGMGCAVAVDGVKPHVPQDITFVPFSPRLTSTPVLAWKKGRSLSKAAALFLEELKQLLREDEEADKKRRAEEAERNRPAG